MHVKCLSWKPENEAEISGALRDDVLPLLGLPVTLPDP